MSKKFAEYSQFDLSKVNKDVLKKWDDSCVFCLRNCIFVTSLIVIRNL